LLLWELQWQRTNGTLASYKPSGVRREAKAAAEGRFEAVTGENPPYGILERDEETECMI
jgi:hypothetical protein